MTSRKEKYLGYVVLHTHWDRAWYQPFEQFRLRLVDLLDDVIRIFKTNKRFQYFTLDGQSVVLEDYLEIRPQQEAELRKLVSSGKLQVGPFYILPDEYLVSGEALIRNLIVGHRVAERFGMAMPVGYVPDSFGHVSQLPQILNGFGIDTFIFTRGMGDEGEQLGSEFWWVGPDGKSRVLAVHQIHGYGNAHALGVPYKRLDFYPVDRALAFKQVEELMQVLKRYARTRHVLLNNGMDHEHPQQEIQEIIDYVNRHARDYRLRQSTFQEYLSSIKRAKPRLRSFCGELHGGRYHIIISGVYSSRMPLKQANERTQSLLEKYVEPLWSFAALHGASYPRQELLYAWKTLLKNHPHDDICGCSIDGVHRDMVNRFERVEQVGSWQLRQATQELLCRIKTKDEGCGIPLAIFNPLNWKRRAMIKARVIVPHKMFRGSGCSVVDHQGVPIAATVRRGSVFRNPALWGERKMQELDVELLTPMLPSCGYCSVYVVPGPRKPEAQKQELRLIRSGMENAFYRLRIHSDGTVTIIDKETGLRLNRVHWLEDCADRGDEYDFSPVAKDVAITTKGENADVQIGMQTPYCLSYVVRHELAVPRELTSDRNKRVRALVRIPITTEVILHPGIKRVDFRTTVGNRARDHRLRVAFDTPIKTAKVDVESSFDVVTRKIALPAARGWAQSPMPTHHQGRFASLSDGKLGVTFINKGLPEYEVKQHARGVRFFQTLFRSIGWRSRGDLLTRSDNAGPMVPAPEAQLMGVHTFEYALTTHRGAWHKADSHLAAYEHNLPPVTTCYEHQFRNLKAGAHLPETLSFLQVEPHYVIVSALKQAEKSANLIVRCYNPKSRSQWVRLTFAQGLRRVYLVRLDEHRLKQLKLLDKRTVGLRIGKKQIVTLECEF